MSTDTERDPVEVLAHRIAWRYKKSSDPHHSDTYTFNRATLLQFAAELEQARAAIAQQPDTLPPVEGDVLPPIGAKVLIHLASQDAWVEHTVVGYYVWPKHGLVQSVFRVFVRVRSRDGYLNARCLQDIRYPEPATELEGAAIAQPAERSPMTAREIEDHIGPDEGDREAVEALVREVEAWHGITPTAVTECTDNDSPWLVCKPCAAAGKCKQADAQPVAPGSLAELIAELRAALAESDARRAAPTARQPLTLEQLKDLWVDVPDFTDPGRVFIAVARAVEKAHGITQEGEKP